MKARSINQIIPQLSEFNMGTTLIQEPTGSFYAGSNEEVK